MNKDIFKLLKGSALFKRFLILFIVLATVPVLVMGGVSVYLVDLAHRQDVSQLELQLIDQKIEEIDKFFIDTAGTLELTVDILGEQIPYDQQQFILSSILASNSAFHELGFLALNGRVNSKRSYEQGELSPVGNFLDEAVFMVPASGKKYIGEVHYSNSEPMVTLAAPVRKRDQQTNAPGDIIHILYAETSLEELVTSMENAGVGTGGYVVLADSSAKLIARGDTQDYEAGIDISSTGRVQEVLDGASFNALDDGDRYTSSFSGVPVVGAAKQVPVTGWALLVEWPLSDANAILSDVRGKVVQFSVFALLAVILLAPLFAARLINPINKLEEAARAIEKGKLDTRVDIKTGDELEGLGETFNKMVEGLKRLQELKDEFVFVAAHELRTPVTAIKGYLSLILEGSAGKISDQAEKFLNQTKKANDSLNQLVNDLLEIARSDAGRLEVETAPVNIGEPAKSTVEQLQPLADEKNITLSYNTDIKAPSVIADEKRIKEILVNLAGNAIKYTQEGGRVELFHEVKDGMVATHVKDNGFGISEEDQKELFSKFYRVKTDKTKNIQGTGLGLFIVKQLVEKMGGKIWVNSKEGEGSDFAFTLPVAE
ncbi:MAG: sensor histidine kinase [Candidatus Spechtbacterales bacterium]|nr:sensor histidine kinase [Candidatus Spechtbacterales bacterium]